MKKGGGSQASLKDRTSLELRWRERFFANIETYLSEPLWRTTRGEDKWHAEDWKESSRRVSKSDVPGKAAAPDATGRADSMPAACKGMIIFYLHPICQRKQADRKLIEGER